MSIGLTTVVLFAVFGIFILFLVCATVLMCSFTPVLLIIFTIVLALFIVPSILSFIINSAVYKNMYSMIVDKDSKSKTIDKKMENRRKGQFRDDEEPVAEDYSDLEIDESADGDEFIFYNGKMMKRSYLLKLKKEAEKVSSCCCPYQSDNTFGNHRTIKYRTSLIFIGHASSH